MNYYLKEGVQEMNEKRLNESLSRATCTENVFAKCKHSNGWFDEVKFGIFSKRIFICTDCMEIIDSKD